MIGAAVLLYFADPLLRATDSVRPTSVGSVAMITVMVIALSIPALAVHLALPPAVRRVNGGSWLSLALWTVIVGGILAIAIILSVSLGLSWAVPGSLGVGPTRLGAATGSTLVLLWACGELVFAKRGTRTPWARLLWSCGVLLAIGIAVGLLLA